VKQRQLTKLEIKAYRLCHHVFEGLTVKEAASALCISESKVRQLLKSAKLKASQLFPILTKRQYLIYRLYVDFGQPQSYIAKSLKTTQSNIQKTLNRMKKRGMIGLDKNRTSKIVGYKPSMDAHIKRKF